MEWHPYKSGANDWLRLLLLFSFQELTPRPLEGQTSVASASSGSSSPGSSAPSIRGASSRLSERNCTVRATTLVKYLTQFASLQKESCRKFLEFRLADHQNSILLGLLIFQVFCVCLQTWLLITFL